MIRIIKKNYLFTIDSRNKEKMCMNDISNNKKKND